VTRVREQIVDGVVTAGEGLVDPVDAEFLADPYAAYARARRLAPVQRHPNGVYMVFGYDDVKRVLGDRALSSSERYALDAPRNLRIKAAGADDAYLLRPALAKLDPPEHKPLRSLLAHPFTRRSIGHWVGRTDEIVAELLDAALADPAGFDVVTELAQPLPCRLVCEMFGIPVPEDMARLYRWTSQGLSLLDPFLTPEQLRAATAAQREFTGYLQEVIAWKRRNLADDVLSAFIAAGESGEVIGPERVAATVQTLVIAGFDTTVNQIGLSVLTLMRHRDQWERLVADPALVDDAVEELLRVEPTAQLMIRTVPEDYRIGDAVVPAGNHLVPWLGSANRDPRRFGPTADAVDITRPDSRDHVSFGFGVHLCLGVWLARIELRAVLRALVTRAPHADLAGDPVWASAAFIRGLSELRLTH